MTARRPDVGALGHLRVRAEPRTPSCDSRLARPRQRRQGESGMVHSIEGAFNELSIRVSASVRSHDAVLAVE